jgi:hypothetical protein
VGFEDNAELESVEIRISVLSPHRSVAEGSAPDGSSVNINEEYPLSHCAVAGMRNMFIPADLRMRSLLSLSILSFQAAQSRAFSIHIDTDNYGQHGRGRAISSIRPLYAETFL